MQQEFDVSKEECLAHQTVIQELKHNLEEVQGFLFINVTTVNMSQTYNSILIKLNFTIMILQSQANYEVQYLEGILANHSRPPKTTLEEINALYPHRRGDGTQQNVSARMRPSDSHSHYNDVQAQIYKNRYSQRPRTTTPRMYSTQQPLSYSTNSVSSNEQDYFIDELESAYEFDPSNRDPSHNHLQSPICAKASSNDFDPAHKTLSHNHLNSFNFLKPYSSDFDPVDVEPSHNHLHSPIRLKAPPEDFNHVQNNRSHNRSHSISSRKVPSNVHDMPHTDFSSDCLTAKVNNTCNRIQEPQPLELNTKNRISSCYEPNVERSSSSSPPPLSSDNIL